MRILLLHRLPRALAADAVWDVAARCVGHVVSPAWPCPNTRVTRREMDPGEVGLVSAPEH
eukprot:366073-Chlamydomonas_euryale.AAC.6